jgi:thiamine-monophosphate kinase
MDQLTIRDIGEQGLLAKLQRFCLAEVVGDDAAVLTPEAGKVLVITTDMLIDGVHFSEQTTTAADAGWRAAAANLSDLAAMGATPLGLTVGLGLPGSLPVTWVEQLYQGMTECLHPYQAAIVGGDVVRSPVITLAITALGEVPPHHILRRSAAQPGDAIVVTGPHGVSRAGLELLLHPERGVDLDDRDRRTFIRAHQRPRPRLDVLPLLFSQFESAPEPLVSIPVAGMDSSDGLADAICQICRASGVGARLWQDHLPVPAALSAWVGQETAIAWSLYGGEDFELVLCLPLPLAKALVNQLGAEAAIVGEITAETGVWLVTATGEVVQPLKLEQGFQHFEP